MQLAESLPLRMRAAGVTHKEVARETEVLGLNKGKGYSYDYVRRVIGHYKIYHRYITPTAVKVIKRALKDKVSLEKK